MPKGKALRRAIAHLLVGSACVAVILAAPHWLAVLLFATGAAFFLLMDLSRLEGLALFRPFSGLYELFLKLGEQRSLSGAFYFLAGTLISTAAFDRQIAAASILFLTWADPAASLTGRILGRTHLWNDKTLEGSLACLWACALVAVALFFSGTITQAWVLVAGVVSTTVLEALPWPLDDNLSLPVGSAVVMLAVSLLAN